MPKTRSKVQGENENQGEGDKKSARRYNEATRRFVETHDVEKLGRAAKPRSGKEAAELERAEAKGKGRAKK